MLRKEITLSHYREWFYVTAKVEDSAKRSSAAFSLIFPYWRSPFFTVPFNKYVVRRQCGNGVVKIEVCYKVTKIRFHPINFDTAFVSKKIGVEVFLMTKSMSFRANQSLSRTVLGLHRVGSRLSTERSTQAKDRGVDVLHLSGTPTTPPGENVIEAAQKAARENRHSPSRGLMELREAVSQKLRTENNIETNPVDEILVTNGAQQALFIAILGIIDSGDEVIIPTPAYFTDGIVRMAGGVPIFAPMKQEEGFRLDASKIEKKVSSKTKLLILTNPVNPTGYVATRDDLLAIGKIAERNNLMVISDESYEKILFDGKKHVPIVSLEGMYERTVTIHSCSKSYAMAGWRVGYLFGPPPIINEFVKISEWLQLHGNYICQKAVAAAITGPQDWVERIRLDIQENRNILCDGLSEISNISFVRPSATPNIYPNMSRLNIDDEKFSNFLLESFGIRTEPGPAFNYPGHVRIQFCASKETIRELVKRLKRAVKYISEETAVQ